ncbi:DUF4956 domain-containing protein [Spongiactinospora gelatinilytica]|uniref:DUF4956 domain-containing protein n=1 Tax=Spongiactinospora gelatinilytica TaxID=2666298 RepID=A0A2W2GQ88_9ACTN|nr:DUF4956 domain-containing protein [Spongiactinospora gelatinilytica]PZG36397.1 DUF4956 domain-containing protein [Spongiactinospora gelatinilytica]
MRSATVVGLLLDLAAIAVLAYGLYFRRHHRRDLLFAYVALNVGIFAVVSLLQAQRVDLAVGFGLFGVLSIIRLRSNEITQGEIAYYFVAIALGLVNGIASDWPLTALFLDAVLLGVMYVADHPRLLEGIRHQLVTLDRVHSDPRSLVADLENRLRVPVLRWEVTEVDYVRELMVVNVRYQDSPARLGAAR